MRRLISLATGAVMVASLSPVALAAPMTHSKTAIDTFPIPGPPEVSAASWILYDETLDTVVAAQNSREERAMASITKIMTALLTLENGDLGEEVVISARAAATGEKEIDLVAGETVTLDALLKSLMIHSANDAATAAAEHVAGSVEAFVDLMNQRAVELGMANTSFANPHGLDAPGHYTTAEDMLILARAAMADPRFREITRAKVVVIPEAPDGTARKGTTTNLLLDWYEGTVGIKTGFTSQALLTYVAVAEKNGRRLYAVLLGSEGERGHFADATELFEYGFRDLGFFGNVATGSHYVAAMGRSEPDPLLMAGEVESYVHLAGRGLFLEGPVPIVTASEEPEQEPVTEVDRHPDTGPQGMLELITHWFSSLTGA